MQMGFMHLMWTMNKHEKALAADYVGEYATICCKEYCSSLWNTLWTNQQLECDGIECQKQMHLIILDAQSTYVHVLFQEDIEEYDAEVRELQDSDSLQSDDWFVKLLRSTLKFVKLRRSAVFPTASNLPDSSARRMYRLRNDSVDTWACQKVPEKVWRNWIWTLPVCKSWFAGFLFKTLKPRQQFCNYVMWKW